MKSFTSLDERRIDVLSLECHLGSYKITPRNPKLAALLSLIPGLGQIYNGETGKGLLFAAIALVNLGLMVSLVFPGLVHAALEQVASALHLTVNWTLTQSIATSPAGMIAGFVYLSLLLTFSAYCANEAYNHAQLSQQGTAFPRYFLGLPEVTSSSYLLHFVFIGACFFMVLFVVSPPPPQEQATVIEFVPPPPPKIIERPKPRVMPKQISPPQSKPQLAVKPPVPVKTTQPVIAPPLDSPQPTPTLSAASETGSTSGASGVAQSGSGDGTAGQSTEVDFGAYLAEMQRRIKKAWYPPRGNESKRITVKFKVSRTGNVSAIRLEKSSGVSIADDAAIAAVEQASPFPSLPSGSPEKVDIRFTFDYNIFGGNTQSNPGINAGVY